jgi:hypothetical protein
MATMTAARASRRARLHRLAPLDPEPPDQNCRPDHVGQDAEPDREDAQAVILQPGCRRNGTGDHAEGNRDRYQPQRGRDQLPSGWIALG